MLSSFDILYFRHKRNIAILNLYSPLFVVLINVMTIEDINEYITAARSNWRYECYVLIYHRIEQCRNAAWWPTIWRPIEMFVRCCIIGSLILHWPTKHSNTNTDILLWSFIMIFIIIIIIFYDRVATPVGLIRSYWIHRGSTTSALIVDLGRSEIVFSKYTQGPGFPLFDFEEGGYRALMYLWLLHCDVRLQVYHFLEFEYLRLHVTSIVIL